MIAGFFCKPLQGARFTKFRHLILNVKEEIWISHPSSCSYYFMLNYIFNMLESPAVMTGLCWGILPRFPLGCMFPEGLCIWSRWGICSPRNMPPIPLVHMFSEEYFPDPWQGICPLTTKYPFPTESCKLSVAIMTCSVVRRTRLVWNRNETTKYDHISCFVYLY